MYDNSPSLPAVPLGPCLLQPYLISLYTTLLLIFYLLIFHYKTPKQVGQALTLKLDSLQT